MNTFLKQANGAGGAQIYVVTGANRGLGRAISVELSRRATAESPRHILLVGRNQQGLESTAFQSSTGTHAHLYALGSVELTADAGKVAEQVISKLQAIVASLANTPAMLCLVNCAGTISDLSKTVDQYTADEVALYTQVNFVSFASLTSGFLAFCKEMDDGVQRVGVVNISSLLAVKAFANWGLYAALKAARDQYLLVAALENADGGRTRVLNYAPGPLDNDMQADVRAQISDLEQKKIYDDMHRQGKLVKVQDTARVMCELLDKWEFQSGAHVDYYDI
ncbi:hypothetical protein J3B02_005581 [Coemansia erecta]|uniref:Sepiapterin reductase n=1 Tax=Coemansia asiatica TaxID=1052880 RepID=A0A9W7XHR3_9FUNG|nr:hypothetical protein LPJ64_005422 [Coemansia asiatica]KAJ2842427.1 hypothetical protein J3B02_005581 [Coemansia erecta]KAJ2856456.1 hypothetical protein FB639_006105 [Coemansia asiatica]